MVKGWIFRRAMKGGLAALLTVSAAANAQPVHRDTVTRGASGYPIPRFVSLEASKANMRVGPSQRYPVAWQYRRAGLPLLVVAEFEHWREVRTPDGETGWMHVVLLSGERTVQLTGPALQTLRSAPNAGAPGYLKAEPGVIGRLERCEGAWCRVRVNGRTGWLRRARLWGVFTDGT